MQKDAIRYLIGQYMKDELTAQQQVELLQLLGRHEENELIDVLREMLESEPAAVEAVDAGTMQATLERVLATDKAPAPAMGRLVRMSRRWRWVAAAVCLLAIGTAAYVLLNKKEPAPVVATAGPYKNDVQPGGNKAILTLGNGKQIVLDSAANGLLAQDGNAAIRKEDAGLKYESAIGNEQSAIGNRQSAMSFNTLSTPRGGEYKLILPDGSKVWLNAASSIRYPTAFADNERKVEITGEAYFEVATLRLRSGQKMPFHVKTSGQDIEVLGTHFNVNAYRDEGTIKTTLLEGKVKVSSMVNGQWSILKPGEQVSVSHSSQLSKPIPVQTEEVLAWKNGLFLFDNASIESIMKQISRWYNVEVTYAGKPIQEGFTATISRNVPVSKLLRYLELTTLVHFKIDGNRITVME
jgi:transmembrane sensor